MKNLFWQRKGRHVGPMGPGQIFVIQNMTSLSFDKKYVKQILMSFGVKFKRFRIPIINTLLDEYLKLVVYRRVPSHLYRENYYKLFTCIWYDSNTHYIIIIITRLFINIFIKILI